MTPESTNEAQHQLAAPLAAIVTAVNEKLGLRLLTESMLADENQTVRVGEAIEAAITEAALHAFALGLGAGAEAALEQSTPPDHGRRCSRGSARRR
jgi:hypothetical protein